MHKTLGCLTKGTLIFFIGTILTSCASLEGSRAPIQDPAQTKLEALATHNALRAKHHADPLVWDSSLARFAANYASKCHFKHSHSGYGENLAAGFPSVTSSIKGWYSEKAYYDYNDPEFSPRTGHFTQVIWASTERVGCGFAICNGKNGTPGKYLVCEYTPPGNIQNPGYFEDNVNP